MNAALYTYAVITPGSPPPLAAAILPGAALLAVEEAGVAALVSPVPHGWFEAGPRCRPGNMAGDTAGDMDWLAERMAAHHRVLTATQGAMLPLAFGVLFPDEERLRAWLRQGATQFAASLEAVRGHSEWSIVLAEDVRAHEAWLRGNDPGLTALAAQARGAAAGTAFMLNRRLEKALAAARDARRRDAAQALGIMLESVAGRVWPNATRQPAAVAGWNLLLAGTALPRLHAAVEVEAPALQASGLTLSLSGPWPTCALTQGASPHG